MKEGTKNFSNAELKFMVNNAGPKVDLPWHLKVIKEQREKDEKEEAETLYSEGTACAEQPGCQRAQDV